MKDSESWQAAIPGSQRVGPDLATEQQGVHDQLPKSDLLLIK